jgi:hypothetical protein
MSAMLVSHLSPAPAERKLAASIFLDLSNIWVGLRRQADLEDEWRSAVRLEATNLREVLRAGRPLSRGVVVANADVPEAALARYRMFGQVITREAGRRSGTEQANDETLQVRIYETINALPAGVLVLGTGDGAGASEGRGFIPALEFARQRRWKVEVAGWRDSTNLHLIDWVERTHGVFLDLADFYYSISFIEGGRRSQPISLRHRPTVDN